MAYIYGFFYIILIILPFNYDIDFNIELFPISTARRVIVVISILWAMFCYAKISSFYIAKGNGEFIVDLQQSKLNKISGDNTLAYVGLAGEYFILYGIQTRRVFIDLPPLFVPSFKLELGSSRDAPFFGPF